MDVIEFNVHASDNLQNLLRLHEVVVKHLMQNHDQGVPQKDSVHDGIDVDKPVVPSFLLYQPAD